MKKIFIGLCLISNFAVAARLEDVKILDGVAKPDGFELKLQTKDGPKNSYFFLKINKNDTDSFDKMAHVIKKLLLGEKYKLNLDIRSFSVFPSGSRYPSNGIPFYGISRDQN